MSDLREERAKDRTGKEVKTKSVTSSVRNTT